MITVARLLPVPLALSVACNLPVHHDPIRGTDDTSTSDASTDPSTGAPTSSGGTDDTSGTSSGTTGVLPSPWDGEPLPDAEPGFGHWIDFPDARCRDGSGAGLWLRRGEGEGLIIFFEGGGACFNALTCANNPAHYDPSEGPPYYELFYPDPAVNPVGDWSVAYVPYCTGDVHAGDRSDQVVPDVEGVQQFVGYRNGAAFLERLVPTFSDVAHVLVAGASAGGFGAGVHYDRIARAFPGARVTLLDDSGPPLPDDVLAPCLQQIWSDLWGFDDTLPQDCADCFPSAGGGLSHLATYLAQAHPDQRLGLISSAADVTIRFFFGYGSDDCMPQTINVDAAAYEAGLVDLRDHYLRDPDGVWGTVYVADSTHHVWVASKLDTAVEGVKLRDWIARLIDGEALHLGL